MAIGAAIQAGILQGDVKDILLLDVTPLSLGIETMGSVWLRSSLKKIRPFLHRVRRYFLQPLTNQTSVEIHIVQGERLMASDNKSLGQIYFRRYSSAPRGMPQVEVTFDIDANGILSVGRQRIRHPVKSSLFALKQARALQMPTLNG